MTSSLQKFIYCTCDCNYLLPILVHQKTSFPANSAKTLLQAEILMRMETS